MKSVAFKSWANVSIFKNDRPSWVAYQHASSNKMSVSVVQAFLAARASMEDGLAQADRGGVVVRIENKAHGIPIELF